MNEKLQYAEMLEIPTSTCRISYKPPKKKLFKKKSANLDEPKMELVKKINQEGATEEENTSSQTEVLESNAVTVQEETASSDGSVVEATVGEEVTESEQPLETEDEIISQTGTVTVKKEKKRKHFKISLVGVQFVVIGILIATILVTNALMPNSGINTLIASVFGVEKTTEVDDRNYLEFTAGLPSQNKADILLENGIMSISKSGAIYTPCDGVVSSLVKGTDGKYTMEIEHSQKFKTVVSGVDVVYTSVGEKVYATVPVGYVGESSASMCFYGEDGAIITGYTIGENALVWAE